MINQLKISHDLLEPGSKRKNAEDDNSVDSKKKPKAESSDELDDEGNKMDSVSEEIQDPKPPRQSLRLMDLSEALDENARVAFYKDYVHRRYQAWINSTRELRFKCGINAQFDPSNQLPTIMNELGIATNVQIKHTLTYEIGFNSDDMNWKLLANFEVWLLLEGIIDPINDCQTKSDVIDLVDNMFACYSHLDGYPDQAQYKDSDHCDQMSIEETFVYEPEKPGMPDMRDYKRQVRYIKYNLTPDEMKRLYANQCFVENGTICNKLRRKLVTRFKELLEKLSSLTSNTEVVEVTIPGYPAPMNVDHMVAKVASDFNKFEKENKANYDHIMKQISYNSHARLKWVRHYITADKDAKESNHWKCLTEDGIELPLENEFVDEYIPHKLKLEIIKKITLCYMGLLQVGKLQNHFVLLCVSSEQHHEKTQQTDWSI